MLEAMNPHCARLTGSSQLSEAFTALGVPQHANQGSSESDRALVGNFFVVKAGSLFPQPTPSLEPHARHLTQMRVGCWP